MKTYIPLALLLLSGSALAQEPDFFAKRPVVYQEQDKDARFTKSKIASGLLNAPKTASCGKVVASLLAAYAEAAPYFHRRDEQFFLFPAFVQPITTPQFPAEEFLRHMVRRSLMDGKAPSEWLKTAEKLKRKYKAPIDLARLAYAVEGLQPIDSIRFGVAPFLDRFHQEVELAPSAGMQEAVKRFEAKYIDRDVAWGGLVLEDIEAEPVALAKGRKGKPQPSYTATFSVPLAKRDEALDPLNIQDLLHNRPPPAPPIVRVKLAEKQFMPDFKAAPRKQKYLVRGRLETFSSQAHPSGANEVAIELSDGLIFEDRDWSGYTGFATREDAASCELAVNDLL